MSPTSPMTVAATIGPTPNSSVSVVFDALTAAVIRGLVSRQLVVEAAQVGDELDGDGVSGRGHRPGGLELVEQTGGLSCADLAGDPAGDELAQHRVQPAGDPGAVPGQVTVTLRPHLHHLGVILGAHLRHRRRAQRRDGHRTGVVGIVLVRRPRWPAAAPGRPASVARRRPARRRRRAAGPTDSRARRHPRSPTSAPRTVSPTDQPLDLVGGRPHPQLTEELLVGVEGHRRVRPLVRVDADHHCHHCSLRPTDVRTAVGMSDIRVRRSRLFRATPRRHPDAGTSFGSQAAHDRQTVREPDVRMSRRYEPAAPPWWILNQTDRRCP